LFNGKLRAVARDVKQDLSDYLGCSRRKYPAPERSRPPRRGVIRHRPAKARRRLGALVVGHRGLVPAIFVPSMFKEMIASNGASSSTRHTFSRTSMAIGMRRLASPSVAIHVSMLAREVASGSLGTQTSLGNALAKLTACSAHSTHASVVITCNISTQVPYVYYWHAELGADGKDYRAESVHAPFSENSQQSSALRARGLLRS
jgi:hypothetical protein